MSEPVLVVKVAANLEAFRAQMAEGTTVINTTANHLRSMASAFDGAKIISQAGAVTAQIQALGGVTNLTAAEQSRANRILQEAIEKYVVLGKTAPPEMEALYRQTKAAADSTALAATNAEKVTGSFRQFDGVLASMGINIGPYVKGIEDIAGASGKSVMALGFLGTAGLVLATAMAAWKVGRTAAEFLDLDNRIGNATAKLLGYGDVAGQVAGAKADALNGKLSYQANLLRQAAQAGDENNAVLSEAAQAWNASAEAIEGNTESSRVMGDVRNGIIQTTGQAIAAEEAYRSNIKFTTEVIGEQIDRLADWKAAKAAAESEEKKKKEAAQTEADRVKKLFEKSYASDIAQLTQSDLKALRGNEARTMLSGNGDENIWAKLDELEAREGRARNITSRENHSAMMRERILLSQLRVWAEDQERPPGFANGVTNFSGGQAIVGERGPELVTLPRGSSVTPNHQMGGMSVVTNVTINGSVLSNQAEIARVVGEAMMSNLRSQGFRVPSGA